jgi:Flp pilus assembly protein TadG
MNARRPIAARRSRHQRGVALVYVTAAMVVLLLFTGLAVDLGRAYVVRSNLGTAVDAAALAAAKRIGEGQTAARAEANKIFNVNFPQNYLGVRPNAPTITFGVGSDGSNQVNVSSNAIMNTTFSRVAGFNTINVGVRSQATRRLVDLAFVIDHSGSIGSAWDEVQDASQQFVSYFDPTSDRLSLIIFSTNTVVANSMTATRGFSAVNIADYIDDTDSEGGTGTSEGLYQAWDQLRNVPSGTQSPLRVIVLFTDGAPNGFNAHARVRSSPSSSTFVDRDGVIMTSDFPAIGSSGTDRPITSGLYTPYGRTVDEDARYVSPTNGSYRSASSTSILTVNDSIPTIPLQSFHGQHVSAGIPTGFPLYSASLPGQRVLIGGTSAGYPNHVQNANNAARNLVEIIANAARADTSGAHRIRIYTLGLGDNLNQNRGAARETGASILKRVANDRTAPGFNATQPEGKYFYAGDPAQLNNAFEAVRNQIVRFSE